MKVLFLPRYDTAGPSSRYRIYQYVPYIKEQGIDCRIVPLLDNEYVNNLYTNQKNSKFRLLYFYLQRLLTILRIDRYDIIFLEKEFFPVLPDCLFLFKLLKIKYIVDYDDAIFHDYDQSNRAWMRFFYKNKIAQVIAHSQFTTTGSPYLTSYVGGFNLNVVEIPTSIDLNKYPITAASPNSPFVIGWIGSKTTSKHILPITEALRQFSKKYSCTVRLIGFDSGLMSHFNDIPIEVVQWSEKEEVNHIKTFSVGIMPLIDAPFERGKCGFKLIQYMACGIPTIATPLETNVKINRDNTNLFAADTVEWVSALEQIYHNREKYVEVGLKNRKIVETYYSIQANADKYVQLFNNVIKRKNN